MLLIFILITSVLNIRGDSCDHTKGPSGATDCVKIWKYTEYQWTVCVSNEELRKITNRKMSCGIKSFCWIPCTYSTQKRLTGKVAKDCRCNPDEVRAKRSSDPTALTKAALPTKCYIPHFAINCEWYGDCLESLLPCQSSTHNYALSFGKAVCGIFSEEYNQFSSEGKQWIDSAHTCIENRLRSIIMPDRTSSCEKVHELAYTVHSECYYKGFCALTGQDQMKIFWTIKQVFQNAFKENYDEGMEKFRACLKNDVYGQQRQLVFYLEAGSDTPINDVDFISSFALNYHFSENKIDWDVFTGLHHHSNAKRQAIADNRQRKGYQVVETMISSRQVEIETNNGRSSSKKLIKTTTNSDQIQSMDSIVNNLSNGLKQKNLQVIQIPVYKRIVKMVGFTFRTGGTIIACWRKLGFCYSSVRNWVHYHQNRYPLPDTPDSIDAKFNLCSRQHQDQLLDMSDLTTLQYFNASKSTFFIIHGYTDNGKSDWIKDMKDTLLSKKDANVIAVDWQKGAEIDIIHPYKQAVVNTEVVGVMIALLTKALEKYRNAENTYMHLIGHSLGSHVAGFAGDAFEQTRYQRITGMDPAGPEFQDDCTYSCKRLDPKDAHFVDVIHTNGGDKMFSVFGKAKFMFGIKKPIGHVDFYPNGGQLQPGCKEKDTLKERITCSHSRAYHLFTESILSNSKFKSFPCESLEACLSGNVDKSITNHGKLGYHTDTSLNNQMFFLETNPSHPYSIDDRK